MLLINDYGPESPRAGGAEVVVRRTREGLESRGIETSLFTVNDVPGHRRTAMSYLHNEKACAALEERLKAFKPSVVHLHNFYHELSPAILGTLGEWKAAAGGRRVVMTAHDFHLVCPNSGLTYFRSDAPVTTSATECTDVGYLISKRWDRRGIVTGMMKLAQHLISYRIRELREAIDLCLCPSAFMAQEFGAAGLPVRVVSNISPEPRATAKSADTILRLIFAGRLEPEKGLLQFLAVAPVELPWALDVVGEGEQAAACRTMAEERGLASRIRWLGRLAHADTMARIGSADVLVLPSIWPENQPLVLLEALAMRTSLLVSDLGGMREIVRGSGVGETFMPRDGGSLAGALQRLSERKQAGTLNAFDAREYLEARDELHHFQSLLRAYGGNE